MEKTGGLGEFGSLRAEGWGWEGMARFRAKVGREFRWAKEAGLHRAEGSSCWRSCRAAVRGWQWIWEGAKLVERTYGDRQKNRRKGALLRAFWEGKGKEKGGAGELPTLLLLAMLASIKRIHTPLCPSSRSP